MTSLTAKKTAWRKKPSSGCLSSDTEMHLIYQGDEAFLFFMQFCSSFQIFLSVDDVSIVDDAAAPNIWVESDKLSRQISESASPSSPLSRLRGSIVISGDDASHSRLHACSWNSFFELRLSLPSDPSKFYVIKVRDEVQLDGSGP